MPKANAVMHYFIPCPKCGDQEAHSVSHLVTMAQERGKVSAGPWSCKECGHTISFMLWMDDGVCYEESPHSYPDSPKVEVLLKMEMGGECLYAVACNHLIPSRYWYEESTCPTNFLRDIEELYLVDPRHRDGFECDPHGLFTVVGYRVAPENGLHARSGNSAAESYWHETVGKVIRSEPTDLLPAE